MINYILRKLSNKLTKNSTEIPLIMVNFNLKFFKENGAKNSCMAKVHPNLQDDDMLRKH